METASGDSSFYCGDSNFIVLLQFLIGSVNDYLRYLSDSSCRLQIDTFYYIARYEKEGCALEFTILTKLESILDGIYQCWGVE